MGAKDSDRVAGAALPFANSPHGFCFSGKRRPALIARKELPPSLVRLNCMMSSVEEFWLGGPSTYEFVSKMRSTLPLGNSASLPNPYHHHSHLKYDLIAATPVGEILVASPRALTRRAVLASLALQFRN